MKHLIASFYGSLVVATLLGCQSPPVYRAAPPALVTPTDATPRPMDPDDPLSAVVWVMGHDVRELDVVWRWLHSTSVPDSPERDLAIGVAGLLGVAELSRFDLAPEASSALERAAGAAPDDSRIPLWRSYLGWIDAYRSHDRAAVERAYAQLRVDARRDPGFTLFGFTLAVAADGAASPELIAEAVDAYERVISETADTQFRDDPASRSFARRLGDWRRAPYNIPGTQVLVGDMALRAGDLELARRSYYTALRTNAAYRWPFRQEVQRRLDRVDELGDEPSSVRRFGAGWAGALGERDGSDARFDGRIGNGTCTLCHSQLTELDREGGAVADVGWIRFRYAPPEGVVTPFPVFVALPNTDGEDPPVGFSIGQVDLAELGETRSDGTSILTLAAEPGVWFVAGQISGGERGEMSDRFFETYAADPLGMPRFIEARAGEIADITDSVMRFSPATREP